MDVLWRIGERLLRWGTRAHCMVVPSVYHSYNRKQYACPIEQKYHVNGTYTVTYHAIDGTHAFIPDVAQEQTFPLVVMVNGTGLKALDYAPVFEHLASWGFIVVGNDDYSAWDGRSACASLDIALQLFDCILIRFHFVFFRIWRIRLAYLKYFFELHRTYFYLFDLRLILKFYFLLHQLISEMNCIWTHFLLILFSFHLI